MKISHGLLSLALLVSVAQLSAGCCGTTKAKKECTTKMVGCCGDRSATTKCGEGCVTDEDGNCICDEKCGCNKPNKAEACTDCNRPDDKGKRNADQEEVLVCEDCEQEVTDEGKCGCNKPNKK